MLLPTLRKSRFFPNITRPSFLLLLCFSGILSVVLLSQPGCTNQTKPGAIDSKSFRPEFVPSNALAVLALRPAELLDLPALKSAREKLIPGKSPQQQVKILGISLTEIELLTSIFIRPEPETKFDLAKTTATVIQTRNELKQDQILDFFNNGKSLDQQEVYDKKILYTNHIGETLIFCDSHTLIFCDESEPIQAILAALKQKQEASWQNKWIVTNEELIISLVNLHEIKQLVKEQKSEDLLRNYPLAVIFSPIWENTRLITSSVNYDGQFSVEMNLFQPENGKLVKDAVEKISGLMTETLKQNVPKQDKNHQSNESTDKTTSELTLEMVNSMKVKQNGEEIRLSASLPASSGGAIMTSIVPMILKSREAERRGKSKSNLRQLMLAMHNYHDKHRHFPTAIVMGPDGKTPHSWRVELLPFLEQQALYDQYHMDEPWDSKHNLKIAETIVPEYHNPNSETPTNASYFAVVGPNTTFGKEGGTQIRDIKDGTSNTIAIVEAERDIPWTKPEDIAYDSDNIPEFGGFHDGGFYAGFCDGSVRFLSDMIEEQHLKNLLQINDGQRVP
ncbi:MAG: hypothetical protein CME32_08540 [Gimesia sp.]|uniref:DUF1559 domain-containing protein n=1 Tax=Gimesia chilikensis TaxID=2605989 RepID=A0A517PRX0_9PLAN|nr:hypothetical protein [Gimesia sp.]QDT22122.1 hypothetical protein HG66A1_39290 [Gimesia chilikensis]